ncbi:MAG: hypothetical protein GY711_10310 [bacterium]|nr:hypothetical protein [bacterium]
MQNYLTVPLVLIALGPLASAQWSTATLSQARTVLAATSDGTRAYFGGGWLGTTNYSDVVDIYDASTGSWTTASLSHGRSELAAASAGGIVVFAGGRDAIGASNVVDIHDPASGTWTTASLSEARSRVGATAVGTRVLFAGGYRGSAATPHSAAVDIYDTQTGVWTFATLPREVGQVQATASDSAAYFTQGYLNSDVVDILDPVTGAWTSHTLSAPRRHIAATRVLDLLLFAGGSSTSVVDVFELQTGTWTTSMLSFVTGGRPAAIGHRALFGTWTVVEIYDVVDGSSTAAPLSVSRGGYAVASTAHQVLFAGGKSGPTFYDVVDIYEPELGTRYCSPGNPNSSGVPARISADGSPFVLGQDLTLIAEDLPAGEFGYFLVGANQGSFQPPGSQGILCLACGFQGCGGLGRFNQAGFIIQGPSGSIAVDITSLPTSPPTAVQPGDTWNFQCWFRDQGSSNFTDAVSILFF